MPEPVTTSFAFRLSREAADALKNIADAHGIPPAAYARTVILDAIGRASEAPPIRRRVMHADLLRDVLGQLMKIGGNFNQIARALNRGEPLPQAAADLESLRRQHEEALQAVVDAVGGD